MYHSEIRIKANEFQAALIFYSGATTQIVTRLTLLMFLNHTQLNTHNGQESSEPIISSSQSQHTTNAKRPTSMLSAGFEPARPGIEQPPTYALYRTGIGLDSRST